jgi:hypothetical protein
VRASYFPPCVREIVSFPKLPGRGAVLVLHGVLLRSFDGCRVVVCECVCVCVCVCLNTRASERERFHGHLHGCAVHS